jgi:hypothetical protein
MRASRGLELGGGSLESNSAGISLPPSLGCRRLLQHGPQGCGPQLCQSHASRKIVGMDLLLLSVHEVEFHSAFPACQSIQPLYDPGRNDRKNPLDSPASHSRHPPAKPLQLGIPLATRIPVSIPCPTSKHETKKPSSSWQPLRCRSSVQGPPHRFAATASSSANSARTRFPPTPRRTNSAHSAVPVRPDPVRRL